MKAKMNFLAQGVDPHPNLVNLVGAVTEGRDILAVLELSDAAIPSLELVFATIAINEEVFHSSKISDL